MPQMHRAVNHRHASPICHESVMKSTPKCHVRSAGKGEWMDIEVSYFGDFAKRVTLKGRLDIAGAQKIELPLAALAGTRANIVVDMRAVELIAAIGSRHLVMAAKAVARGGGRLVLLDPTAPVTEVLVTAGLAQILPIVRSDEEARSALGK